MTEGRISTLRVLKRLEHEELMRILNLESLNREEIIGVEAYMSKKGTAAFLLPLALGIPSINRRYSDRLVATKLQAYVDEWLETGYTDEGEHPKLRSMLDAPDSKKLLGETVKGVSPRLMFFPADADYFAIDLRNDIQVKADPVESALERASLLLMTIMLSDLRESLCKCRYCGTYFLKEKFKKTPYAHGIFCSRRHQGSFHAQTHIDSNRKQVTSKLIAFAAKFLIDLGIRDSMWQGDKSRKERLASRISGTPVCRRLLRTVKANWVTLHQAEIEIARVKLTNQTVTG